MNRLLVVATLSAAALFAQDDPPSRVARLNWISGDVSFQPSDLDAWTNATINYPLTTGDQLYAGQGGRAELHIGPNAIRIGSGTSFGFLNLDDAGVQMSLDQGVIEVRVRQLDSGDAFEIDTPNGAVTLDRAGDYRIESDPNRNATRVTVRDGQAEMYGDGPDTAIYAHQTIWFGGGPPNVQGEGPRDDFDNFVVSRNAAEDRLPRYNYVDPSMEGYEDLYTTGSWSNDPEYGDVWAPPVAAGWAPYSTGRWAYVEPWGWTWIDEAPWGFAPFHYGRWAYSRSRWVWIPGQRTGRPVYAPALVAFIGGASFGVSVGWFPLGPREPWIPSWRASDAYVRRANARYVPNFNGNVNVATFNYVNQRNSAAVTIVSRNDFVAARPVRNVSMRGNAAQLQGGQILGSAPRFAPERASVMAGQERGRPSISNRQVVVKRQPPPPAVSFQARQNVLSQNQGRPLDRSQVAQLRQQQPTAVVARPAVRNVGQQDRGQGRGPDRGGFNSRGNAAPNAQPPAPQPNPAARVPQNPSRPDNNPIQTDPTRGRRMVTPPQPAPQPVAPQAQPQQQRPQPENQNRPNQFERGRQQQTPRPEIQRPAPASVPNPAPRTEEPSPAPQPVAPQAEPQQQQQRQSERGQRPQQAPRPEVQHPAPAPAPVPHASPGAEVPKPAPAEGRGRGRGEGRPGRAEENRDRK